MYKEITPLEWLGGTSILPKGRFLFVFLKRIVETFSAQSSGEDGLIAEKR